MYSSLSQYQRNPKNRESTYYKLFLFNTGCECRSEF
nr:MAG TPA: hypothetical protein [Caudoviricetes sp.]